MIYLSYHGGSNQCFPTPTLLSHWPFNSDNLFKNLVSHDYDLEDLNNYKVANDRNDQSSAVEFTEGYGKIKKGSLFQFINNGFSLSSWIKIFNINNAFPCVLSLYPQTFFKFCYRADKNQFYLKFKSNSWFIENTAPLDTWTFVALTCQYNSTNIEFNIYVNGLRHTKDVTGTITRVDLNTEYDGYIGKNSIHNPFSGIIDDVKIYNRALIPDEIKYFYEK